MATYKPLQSVVLTAATSSVTFSGIDQGYTDLVLVTNAILASGGAANLWCRFNGDSGANYSTTYLAGSGTAATSGRDTSATEGWCGRLSSSNWTSSIASFQNYANTTTFKTTLSRGNDTSGLVIAYVSLWRATPAAINSIVLTNSSAVNFEVGSTFSLYGIKSGAPQALGGDLVTTDGNYWYHTFRSTQNFTPLRPLTVDYLVVAGGGGASGGGTTTQNQISGGGGAGGLRSTVTNTGGLGSLETPLTLAGNTSYTVTVGGGGAAGPSNQFSPPPLGSVGSNSVFATITSTGGGFGATQFGGAHTGGAGGSGGGGGSGGVAGTRTASPVQGFNGGDGGVYTAPGYSGGGGGGAGGDGLSGNSTSGNGVGGNGGPGVAVEITGSSVTYAGGGGGGNYGGLGTAGSGGAGGGGNATLVGAGVSGTVNTGGGGGSGGSGYGGLPPAAGAGGSGIVIVRYPV